MNETRRTVTYLALAVVLALCAWWLSPPVEITPQELVAARIGTEFYPDFNDPNEPTSIRVVAFDEAKAMHRTFGVSFENGKWTIPSRHNYPADGADRLAKTAASVMHIKRDEMAVGGETEQAHEKLGVVDPLDEDVSRLKGRGQRITLSKGDTTLVDLIIGKQLRDRPGYYYIRKLGENTTYVAKLTIDLSTKFSDWIETDLLKLNRDDLKEVVIDNYSIDEINRRLTDGEVNTLDREKSADPWKLAGLDESKEELDTAKVNTLVSTLDDLKLVGVRPKPKGLRPNLTLDPEYVRDATDARAIQRDLMSKGFVPLPDRNNPKEARLYSNEGELVAATNKGVVYTLKFGEVFSGDETEIEIGAAKEGDEDDVKGEKDQPKEDGEKNKDTKGKEDKPDVTPGKQPSRYLFVTAQFDQSYLGEPPTAPERPAGLPAEEEGEDAPAIKPGKKKKPNPVSDEDGESKPDASTEDTGESPQGGKSRKSDEECAPPAGAADDKNESPDVEDAAADKKEQDAKAKDKAKADVDGDEGTEKPEKAPAAGEKSTSADEKKKEKSAEDLKKEYDANRRKYKSDLKAYEEKVAAGKKQAEELSARFGEWYYVIPAESFNKLHLKRSDLVKSKTKAAPDAAESGKSKDPFTGEEKEPGEKDDDAKDEEKKKDDAKQDVAKPEPPAKQGAPAKEAKPDSPKKDAPKKEVEKKDASKKVEKGK